MNTAPTASPSEPSSTVLLGATFELEIERISYGGAGVGRLEGKVVFVPFTIPGERVSVRVVRDQKRFAEAVLLSIVKPAPERIPPKCVYFAKCGGCAYQHVDYSVQLAWKTEQVRELLQRVARISEPRVLPTLPSPKEWAFRNRIRVHSRDGKVGFFAKHSHRVVDVVECAIAQPEVNAKLASLRQSRRAAPETTLSAGDGGRFFEQTNFGAASELVRLVESMAGDGLETLVDAYSGAGFFGHRLSAQFERVVGIESHEGAVAAARRQAGANEHYICGDVATHLGAVLGDVNRQKTLLLLDPPAAGVAACVTDLLVALPVKRLVYVSCDPATQARDLGVLVRGGYSLEKVVPVDMFPQTADVEVVAELHWST